jgi:hypothetical protein
MLKALAPAAGIGGIVLRLVGLAELDEQLDWPPPALADELAPALLSWKPNDIPASENISFLLPWLASPIPVALALTPNVSEGLKDPVEALELVEQPPELPLTPV